MSEFSELANYLAEQIEVGTDDVILDEPWTFTSLKTATSAMPSSISHSSTPNHFESSNFGSSSLSTRPAQRLVEQPKPRPFFSAAAKIVIPESAKSVTLSAYENANRVEEFYSLVAAEKLYAKTRFVKGEGNLLNPKLLLVVYAPTEDYLKNGYFNSEVGQMVARMFGSLKIDSADIAVTYFCKKQVSRTVLPQVALVLKKMLEKEVALVKPQTVIFFGDRLLKQALSQNMVKVVDFGGNPLEFAGTQATVLIDPEDMFINKQLKLMTWKIQIPKCGFFN